MTVLLQRAFERLAKLPERDQDFYAEQLLRELDGDERWAELFALTTDAEWETMVAGAKQDAADEGTLSLSDLEAELGTS